MRHPAFSLLLLFALSLGTLVSGCADAYKRALGTDTEQVFTRIFLTDFNTAWQSALEALKTSPLDVTNREAGVVQTKWSDNTAQKNFSESFGAADSFLKAQYRVRVSLAKGFYNGKPSVKVAVQKEQLVQRDVLEGWRPIESDSIEEKTLLYRIGRIIAIRTKLARIEEERIRKSLQTEHPFGSPEEPPAPPETPPSPETPAEPEPLPPSEPVLEPAG